jgi:hypothetical protein
MRPQKATIPLFLLLAVLFTACTQAIENIEPGAQPGDTSPPAADINAAASQAAEEATAVAEPDAEDSMAPTETAAPADAATAKGPQINRRVDVPDDIRVNWLIPWDGILPIYKPEFAPAEQAPLQDDELIIGVAWDGEAKAYPITVLRSREMVNDELAGIPTLVTW